jgi:hypothetical protein
LAAFAETISDDVYCIATIRARSWCIAQADDSPMHAKLHPKWDLLILAFAAAGSWMLAEHSHRIDLGASDDSVVAAAPAACDARASVYASQPTIMAIDEGYQVASDDAGPVAPPDCP